MTDRDIRSVDALVKSGLTSKASGDVLGTVAARYAVAITPAMIELIDKSAPDDPIAAQFVPTAAELLTTPDELADPIGDEAHSPVKCIVHRYPDRVLLKAVGVCPVYCRFCFRREMVGPDGDGNPTADELESALAYIASHDEIWEVILTGGDPLVLSPRRMRQITHALAAIPHVKILRIHSRVPVVSPEKVTDELADALNASGKTVYLALHANHAREMTEQARAACARLIDAGIVMVSQSVLLKGINDNVEALASLMRAFVETRVKPYYLHHPDLAPGTSHFRLTIAEGQALMRALRARVSGLCLPAYILDLPGGYGKVAIGEGNLSATESSNYSVIDREGRTRSYP
ncbi:lysine-2,3-aminomutase-like protein [Agrobacterium sp. ES01]|uniref:lysine-2,3-aminomutase-like protein n=1 Tax=Agrobacterium sp. ES01 TaxID=3420714 RepID=UPI003D124579